jgi:hypothetical protein
VGGCDKQEKYKRTCFHSPHATVIDEAGSTETGNFGWDVYSKWEFEVINRSIVDIIRLWPKNLSKVYEDVGMQYANASEARFIAPDGYGNRFCQKLFGIIVEFCSYDFEEWDMNEGKEEEQTSFYSDWSETKIADMWKVA